MSYTLLIKKQAKKTLQSVPQPDRTRIAEKIVLLGKVPDDPILDIKKLKGETYFRLRVGSWRIIFDKDDEVRIISIEKMKPRGGAYK